MPVNRNALIRYNTIDNCLKNSMRQWTLEDLIEACSEALYEYEGIDKGVSKRTVQMDIQTMRSEKLGYNAPIIVLEKKFYTYEDSNYSISNIPLTDQDLSKLTEVVDILRQFKGFSHFKELGGMVQRLEDKVHSTKTKERSIIDLEKNKNLKGLEFIDPIYRAIQNHKLLEVTYQSFKARDESTFNFHGLLLKEHRNRWFVLGFKLKGQQLLTLALDRIIDLHIKEEDSPVSDLSWTNSYFDDVIGVTVNQNQEPEEIKFIAPHSNAPYIETKPLHHSQKVIEKTDEGVIFSIHVQHNFELERDILAFGDRIKVISPQRLKGIIKQRLSHAVDLYNTELNEQSINRYAKRLEHKGYIVANNIFSRKTLNAMYSAINNYSRGNKTESHKDVFAIRRLLLEIPQLKELCLNKNIRTILKQFGSDYFISKAIYFDKPAQSNWYVTWHQDLPINVAEKIETDDFKSWTQKGNVTSVIPPLEILKNIITIRIHLDDTTRHNGALKVIPGSNTKIHNDEDIHTIANNSVPNSCEVSKGGINIMSPLTLHSSSKTTNNKHRRVIHLEFSSMELPGKLEWAEKLDLNE